MTQMTIEIEEPIYVALQQEAQQRGEAVEIVVRKYLSIAKLLAQEIGKPHNEQWPEGFFEQTAGCWQGEPLVRAPQGEFETRLRFE